MIRYVPVEKKERNERLKALIESGMSQAEAARILGISRERVRQLVVREGIPYTSKRYRKLPCGTTAAYSRGCRCWACRRANADRHQGYMERRRNAST